MLLRGGDPYAIVRRRVAPFAKNEHNLVSQVDSKAAEHGAGFGREVSKGIQHKRKRNGLALLSRKNPVVRRQKGFIGTRFSHRIYFEVDASNAQYGSAAGRDAHILLAHIAISHIVWRHG